MNHQFSTNETNKNFDLFNSVTTVQSLNLYWIMALISLSHQAIKTVTLKKKIRLFVCYENLLTKDWCLN